MKVTVESSELLKPSYNGHVPPLSTTQRIPLSVFDKISFDIHVAVIYAFRPPTPPNSVIKDGLAKALAAYREYAGRLSEEGPDGDRAILLNDEGVRFVEASIDLDLAGIMPFMLTREVLNFHPSTEGKVEAMFQVQLTRLACGSLVVGITMYHLLLDGYAGTKFTLAWGLSTRGFDVGPIPCLNRNTLFVHRDPPLIEFEHRGVEFTAKNSIKYVREYKYDCTSLENDIVIHKAHFSKEFLTKLKAKVSSSTQTYSTFQSLVAHLWRAVTKARGLNGCEMTHVRIPVDGRRRMEPRVPDGYTGNLVLWAFPRCNVRDLVNKPVQYAAELIREEIAKVNDRYFKSFIDFARSGAVEEEGLVTTADVKEMVFCPNLEVDSWLSFPFYDLDFGEGGPCYFTPSYIPVEGQLTLFPSFIGDGSIDAVVSLFRHNLDSFKLLLLFHGFLGMSSGGGGFDDDDKCEEDGVLSELRG